MLEEVATDDAYERIGALRQRIDQALSDVITSAGLPAHVVSIGAKGCVTFSTDIVHDYREFLEIDDRYNHAHWLFQHNGGVFLPPWGETEQWLISSSTTAPTSTACSATSSSSRRAVTS